MNNRTNCNYRQKKQTNHAYVISYFNNPVKNHDFIVLSKKNLMTNEIKVTESCGYYFKRRIIWAPKEETRWGRILQPILSFFREILLYLDVTTGIFNIRANPRREEYPLNKIAENKWVTQEISFAISKDQRNMALDYIARAKNFHSHHFNIHDFNCKKFALSLLHHIGIKDKILEKQRFPNGFIKDHGIPYQQAKLKKVDSKEPTEKIVWASQPNFRVVTQYNIDDYPKSYGRFFANRSQTDAAIDLLSHYCAHSLFFPRHQHRKEVKAAITEIKAHRDEYNDVKKVVDYVSAHVTPYRDVRESLQRRLDYIELRSHSENKRTTLTPK